MGRGHLRRRAASSRARWPGAVARTPSVLLEVGEVGAWIGVESARRAWLLGELRLSQLRGPVERTAVRRRLTWQRAEVLATTWETPSARRIQLSLPDWPGHVAGQHVDVRLTAPDGYTAQRSYSIASPPSEPEVDLVVERLDDGEVSPYLTDELRSGDLLEVRGPIGGYFVWPEHS